MENKNKNIVGIITIIVAVLLLVALLAWNTLKEEKPQSKTTYEAEQLDLFTSSVLKKATEYKENGNSEGKTNDEIAIDLQKIIAEETSKYSKSEAVDAKYLEYINLLNNATLNPLEDLLDSLTNIDIMGFVTGLLGGSSSEKTMALSLKSNTVCQSVSDPKFCVENLNANVYVKDENVTNWAVVVHPFMTSGSLMYSTVGTLYTDAGYNVLAPDLRGFGNSGGSVAMGYLESLDIYDWIKDLNENYSRYGVNKKPTNIIVHGVSLGGATTLQLATNPDIAAAKGGAYTKNLTQLNVKGFVDDCGYTSMSGIITDMLSIGDMSSITSLLDSFDIDLSSFMKEIQGLLGNLNIGGLENFDIDSLINSSGDIVSGKFTEVTDFFTNLLGIDAAFGAYANNGSSAGFDQTLGNAITESNWNLMEEIFGKDNNFYSQLFGQYKKYTDKNNYSGNTNNNNLWNGIDWDKISGNIYGGDYQIPTIPGGIPSWQNNSVTNKKATLINNTTANSGDFLEGIIGTVLIELIGVGLTEDNYDYYSNSFAEGRRFPSGSNVAIIHGTSDTMVPNKNATTVANNIPSDVKLVEKWDAEGMAHAFILMGSKKDEYAALVKRFSSCVAANNCTSK